jgi:RNA ligase
VLPPTALTPTPATSPASAPALSAGRPLLGDLLDVAALRGALADGLVRVQRHPGEPLLILNYTERAVFDRVWTPVTRACRGLIVHAPGRLEDAVVVARPWPKFFNHGELAALGIALDPQAPVEVTDKADGSLGIVHPVGNGHAVATRGSFASDQALHATAVWQQRYAPRYTPPAGWTVLAEIVYPANRIVLDYGDLDDLVLLGAVEVATGRAVGPHDELLAGWPGPRVDVHDHSTFADALAAPPRPNAEGLVVRVTGGEAAGLQVKLKQADYVRLHRLVTGLTARRLWERAAVHAALADGLEPRRVAAALHLDPADAAELSASGATGEWADVLRASVPEEFGAWIDETLTALTLQVQALRAELDATCARLAALPRKEAAAALARHPHRGIVFALLDGKPVTAQLWAAVRPPADTPFGARSEDVA